MGCSFAVQMSIQISFLVEAFPTAPSIAVLSLELTLVLVGTAVKLFVFRQIMRPSEGLLANAALERLLAGVGS